MLPVLFLLGAAFGWPVNALDIVKNAWWAVLVASCVIYAPTVLPEIASKFGTGNNVIGKQSESVEDPYAVEVQPGERP